MTPRTGEIRIGTSGWSYPHWRGEYYPDDLPHTQWLVKYASDFNTVEINNTFYQLPETKTLKQWSVDAGKDFVFSVKASRYITHMKKLKDPKPSLKPLLTRIRALREKLGPVLFQLPPNWKCNAQRLDEFLAALPAWIRPVFEFRDQSWINREIFGLLENAKAAFCIYELEGYATPEIQTAEFYYVRLHGSGAAYSGAYTRRALRAWASRFHAWSQNGCDVFCYFDNDEAAYAAKNALLLQEMIQEQQ